MQSEQSEQTGLSGTTVLVLAIAGLLIYLAAKNRSPGYNEERVDLERDDRGRLRALTVHRSAH